MEEQLYKISDAAEILDMKSHVIRSWENDHGIECPRNESGHRLYTHKHIDTFLTVKMLKEYGFTLKQIKLLMPNIETLKNTDPETLITLKKRMDSYIITPAGPIRSLSQPGTSINTNVNTDSNTNNYSSDISVALSNNEELREILINIITDAISENIDALSKEIGKNVSELVSKEMNYQLIQHENIINDRIKAMEMKMQKPKFQLLNKNKSKKVKKAKTLNDI